MIVRTAPQRPVELTFTFLDWHVIDTCVTVVHQAIFAKFPVLVSVRAEPVARVIAPFVSVTNGNAVAAKCPQLFYQAILQFFFPFALKEAFGFCAIRCEFGTVTPLGIERVSQGYLFSIATVPAIFSKTDFLDRSQACVKSAPGRCASTLI
jgi:hypothetical protein